MPRTPREPPRIDFSAIAALIAIAQIAHRAARRPPVTPNLETAFMYGAAIDDNPRLADILRTQGFKRTRHAPDRLWHKGPRHGRRFVAFLNPAGDTLTVARPGRDQFTELDVNSPTLETGIHTFTH